MFWSARSYNRDNSVTRSYDEVDSMLSNMFNEFETVFGDTLYKNVDGDYVREIEVPGFNKDTLNIEVSEGILIVSGERKIHDGTMRSIYKRYRMGTFEDVDAQITDGILYLTIKTPKDKKTKIDIK